MAVMKRKFYTEIAYVWGIIFLALGTAFMEKANFGMSMVVAPAYILHLKISQTLSFFSFGMAEYCLQLLLIILLSVIMHRFKLGYLFSFVTAVIYGLVLDLCIALISGLPGEMFSFRVLFFIIGMLGCSVGVAFFFHTYLAPEAYELIVKELTEKSGKSITFVKTTYDITSLSISVILSFVFFGFLTFRGVNVGTLITALCNGWIIGRISSFMDKKWEFCDGISLIKYFEK